VPYTQVICSCKCFPNEAAIFSKQINGKYTKLDKKRNREILRELKINSVLEHTDQYRNNWKQHVQRMDRSRIPRQIMTYRQKGKRSLGRPLKLRTETVTGH
jgi:preprotein translocase subunit SecA